MSDFCKRLESAVDNAIEKIAESRREDTLVFPVFTDLHTTDVNHENTHKLVSALRLITEKIKCSAVINLGDNFCMLGRGIHITNNELKKRFDELFSAVHNASGVPLINVAGNHDGVGTEFFKPDFWNEITKGKYGNTMAVYDDEGCWYYADYDKADLRFVVPCAPHDSDIERAAPTPLWTFGKPQLEWLEKVALCTDKNVIVLSHVPFFYKFTGEREKDMINVWDGERERTMYISSICGDIEDAKSAVNILNNFNAKSQGRLKAVLSGHTHSDSLWLPNQKKEELENPLSCTQLVSASACTLTENEEMLGLSIDIMLWSPSFDELQFIRVGDGADRKIKFE